jgi:hypothetical protein
MESYTVSVRNVDIVTHPKLLVYYLAAFFRLKCGFVSFKLIRKSPWIYTGSFIRCTVTLYNFTSRVTCLKKPRQKAKSYFSRRQTHPSISSCRRKRKFKSLALQS